MDPITIKQQSMWDKIKEMLANFNQLAIEKRLALGLILFSGFILVGGTLYIIFSSVSNVGVNTPQTQLKNFNEELEKFILDIDTNVEEYNFKNLESELDTINSDFEKYDSLINEADELLNQFELPVSSPITESNIEN